MRPGLGARRPAIMGAVGVALCVAGLVSVVQPSRATAAASATPATKYFFTGTASDQANKATGGTATWSTTAPSPTTDIIQQLTPASGTAPANIYEAYWSGTLPSGTSIAGSTMHLDWWFSVNDPSAVVFGNSIDVSVYSNYNSAANTATKIGSVTLATIKATLPTAAEATTDVPITGEAAGTLLITVKVHYDNAGPTDQVHYGSTGTPSYFTFVGGTGSTPTPSATATPSASASASATPSSACTAGSVEANVAVNGWLCPVEMPASSGLGEPSLTHDSGTGNGPSNTPRLFVAAPQSIGNVQNGGSPMYTSLDGGATWSAPVRSTMCSGLSGGDSDVVTDAADNVYTTDLWLGNSCLSVSEDHGKSFTAGNPYGQQLAPGDDRPWLAYTTSSNEIFTTYDGDNALRVDSTAPLANPALGLQNIQETNAIQESAVSSSTVPDSVRQCVCPPGGIAVDNSGGTHNGRVFVSYSYQKGIAISYADPTCAGGACSIAQSSWNSNGTNPPTVVPNSGNSGSAFEVNWNFAPIKVDSRGTVYVMFARAPGFNSGTRIADSRGVQIYYAYSTDGGATFSNPIYVSTEDGADNTAGTTLFPTMDVAAPGVLDMSWYGTPNAGDPNNVPASAQWSAYYTRVTNADGANGGPAMATPSIAILDMHHGCIQSGGAKGCTDRSLLDFYQLSDVTGSPNLIYVAGDATNGVNLWFSKLAVGPRVDAPEAPYGALLLAAGLGAIALAVRSERRRRGAPPPVV